jgi:hypothetical protein
MEKYYTPLGEEFHVGFEYEIFEDFDVLPEKIWQKQIYGQHGWDQESPDFVHTYPGEDSVSKKFRVKFLDQDDMKSEGWILTQEEGASFINFEQTVRYRTDKVKCKLHYVLSTKWMLIYLHEDKTLFAGRIKNISELRKLQKQLGIK